jgi:hypothetical protein
VDLGHLVFDLRRQLVERRHPHRQNDVLHAANGLLLAVSHEYHAIIENFLDFGLGQNPHPLGAQSLQEQMPRRGDAVHGDVVQHFQDGDIGGLRGEIVTRVRHEVGRFTAGQASTDDDGTLGRPGGLAAQDVPGGDDRILVDSGNALRARRRGTRGDDDGVGRELLDEIEGDLLAQLHLHSRLLHLVGQVLDDLTDLLLERGNTGKVHLAAELRFLLVERNLVPPQSGDTRRLQTCGASPGDQDPLRLFRGDDGHLLLPARGRVHDAAGRFRLHDEVDAPLTAPDAGDDVLEAALGGLLRHLRVGVQRPSHGHQIRPAGLQDELRDIRSVDPAHTDHRYVDDLLDGLGEGGVEGEGGAQWGNHGPEDGGNRASRHLEGVDSGLFQDAGDELGLLEAATAGTSLVARDPHDDREIAADSGADRLEDVEKELEPPLERPAVAIGSLVEERGQERAHHGIAVGGVDLDGVQACVPPAADRLGEVVDDGLDLADGELPGNGSKLAASHDG